MAYYKYAPYGEQDSYSGTYTTNYQFTGKEANSDIGLTYFGARFYDPETGRFLTVDPLKQGTNWYVYCFDNPLNFSDNNGKWASRTHTVITYQALKGSMFTKAEQQAIVKANVETDKHDSKYQTNQHYDYDNKYANQQLEKAVELWSQGTKESKAQALEALGRGLHSIQDTCAHTGAYGGSLIHSITDNWNKLLGWLGLPTKTEDDNPNGKKSAQEASKEKYIEEFESRINDNESDSKEEDSDSSGSSYDE